MIEITYAICTTVVLTVLIICITLTVLSKIDKCQKAKLILDERDRKYNWEEKIFDRNEAMRARRERIEDKETAKRERKEEEEKNKDAMQAKIDSLETKIASLKERKTIASILISKLGKLSKDDFRKEKERISGLLDEIEL